MMAQESIALATWVYAALTGAIFIVLTVTVIVARKQLRLMRRDSMRKLVKNLMEQWMSDKIVDARDVLEKTLKQETGKSSSKVNEAELLKRGLNELEKARNPLHRHLLRIPHYFEMVSTLVESDPEALEEVTSLFRETIIHFYEMYQPWINEKRKLPNLERLYTEFEKLYNHARTAREK